MSTPTFPSSCSDACTRLGLVPRPVSVHQTPGEELVLPSRLPVTGPLEWVDVLRSLLAPGTGLQVDAAPHQPSGAQPGALVRLAAAPSLPGEGYDLSIDHRGVRLAAGDTAGLRHGIQTLRQLMPAWASGPAPLPGARVTLPHVRVRDSPALAWRGMHLDVARHFQPLPDLYRFVDLLAAHKLNVLHLHLTDDQGWRFEVLAYPRLTDVGATRAETRLPGRAGGDGTPHGGFYTQDQLRALVGYAQQRGVTIVPEVDLPGHVRALLAAYPEFGEPGAAPVTTATSPGIFTEVLHLGDATVAMVEAVLEEVLDVFPSELVHVGGDECPREQWHASPASATLAAERRLDGVDGLQAWFTAHLGDWLAARGRRLVGWDEIVGGPDLPGVSPEGPVVMAWRGHDRALAALARGYDVVECSPPLYFDMYQAPGPDEPRAIGGLATWEDVLAVDPYAAVPDGERARLVGVQGQLWTEYLPTPRHVEYMAFPRTAALAELAWHGPGTPPGEFLERLGPHLARFDALGVGYRPIGGPRAWQRGGTGTFARGRS